MDKEKAIQILITDTVCASSERELSCEKYCSIWDKNQQECSKKFYTDEEIVQAVKILAKDIRR